MEPKALTLPFASGARAEDMQNAPATDEAALPALPENLARVPAPLRSGERKNGSRFSILIPLSLYIFLDAISFQLVDCDCRTSA
jgi:hypothetical protein